LGSSEDGGLEEQKGVERRVWGQLRMGCARRRGLRAEAGRAKRGGERKGRLRVDGG
jgi:hypothetical protein